MATLIVLSLVWVSGAPGQDLGSAAEREGQEVSHPPTAPPQNGDASRGLQRLRALWSRSQQERAFPRSYPPVYLRNVESKIEDLSNDIDDYGEKTKKANERLEVIGARQKELGWIKSAATRLREEVEGRSQQSDQPRAPVDDESLSDDDPDLSGVKNWRANRSFAPSSQSTPRRTLAEINADLRENGLEVEWNGEKSRLPGAHPQRRFQTLEQLETWIEERTEYLAKHEGYVTKEQEDIQDAVNKAAEKQQDYRRKLEEMTRANEESNKFWEDVERDFRTAQRTQEIIDELGYGDLFEALVEEMTSPTRSPSADVTKQSTSAGSDAPPAPAPYVELFEAIVLDSNLPSPPPSPPSTTAPSTPGASRPTSTAGPNAQLLDALDNDRLSRDEPQPELEQESSANPIVDEETHRQAQSISQSSASEAAIRRAASEYQQLLNQNANAQQIQRAQDAWNQAQAQWQQQQIQQQQIQQQRFNQAFQQALSGLRNLQSSQGTPSTSRSTGAYTPRTPRGGGGPNWGRKGGNAQGFDSGFSPVKDPNRRRQLQETFGNRNRR